MRVNLEWLREWVDVDADGARLAEELTTAGLEVDAVLPAGPTLEGVVIGHVVACKPHPGADKLSICVVDDGQGRHEVVCGAPNVAAGVKAPFARPGAALPGGAVISAAPVRGVMSHGMLCSARELELSDDSAGLLLLDADAPVGARLDEHLRLDDEVLDIDITPNRGDCFSVIGIAREIGAKRGRDLHAPDHTPVPATIADAFPVELRAGADCPRFAGRVIRGIPAGLRSPLWMRERLRRAGLRPIHPIVDVTNYVMLELGQPLHAYDLGRLNGRIIVRRAAAGEKLALLDGDIRALGEDVLVIADESGAIGMAGIMGGATTAVSSETTDVFLESAFFTPAVIAGRARRYGLHTDASLRFERGVDPAGQARAIERATRLLLLIAGGQPGPTRSIELGDELPRHTPVHLRHSRVEALLGLELAPAEVENLLARLGIELRRKGGGEWEASPPSFRFDISIEEDLIEEVGRMVGYDRIPVISGQGATRLGSATELSIAEERFADVLIPRGYHEIVTYGFVEQELDRKVSPNARQLELANPLSRDLAVMRSSLWPGLLLAARQNLAHQQTRLKLFEIGHRYEGDSGAAVEVPTIAGLVAGTRHPEHWDTPMADADFFDIKGDTCALLRLAGNAEAFRFEAAPHPALHPGQSARIMKGAEGVGWLGSIHPKLQRELELKRPVLLFTLRLDVASRAGVPVFRPYTKYPVVRRDLALVVGEGVEADALLEHARAAVGDQLQRAVVFDVYTGPGIEAGRKSVALGLILQGVSRTLTDADADRAVGAVIDRLERELGARIRI
jgi:phenylalanyl-tRNA synthetase beta chain